MTNRQRPPWRQAWSGATVQAHPADSARFQAHATVPSEIRDPQPLQGPELSDAQIVARRYDHDGPCSFPYAKPYCRIHRAWVAYLERQP